MLERGRDTINCKIVFGKSVPLKSIDVSCLINIGDGEDLASVLV